MRTRQTAGNLFGPLAQLVEQKTFNLLVDGSNPSRPTSIQEGPGASRGFFCSPKEALSGQATVGSTWRGLYHRTMASVHREVH
jgi:hypothetical protein